MEKILVCNRGEIALRIMKTARKLGKKVVAVYSDADKYSPHVSFADEAYCLGQSDPTSSYLNIDKILDVARLSQVDGIHPGYGFLSENADFARIVGRAGITFIGPPAESIEIMGDKLKAKEAVRKYNTPMLPGSGQPVQDIEDAKKIAHEIGYPILLKAAAGGGGKGMRIVHQPTQLAEQLERAKSESNKAFGDDAVFIEKYLEAPRHVEIQIFGDQFGNYLHLYERECSIQRRHQKLIEEAPCSFLTEELRYEMGQTAIDVARSCNYTGAGTVEFLMDSDGKFYFLEMNTRLQVEHPVTEMITGIDLVALQFHVAEGNPLTLQQSEIPLNGHAIELRIYAENVFNEFSPEVGTLTKYILPEVRDKHIRVDNGYIEGMDIPVYYDSMISKLIVWGETRLEAIEKMKTALGHYDVEGVATSLPFGLFVMNHQSFVKNKFDTHFIQNNFGKDAIEDWTKMEREVALALAYKQLCSMDILQRIGQVNQPDPEWKSRGKRF